MLVFLIIAAIIAYVVIGVLTAKAVEQIDEYFRDEDPLITGLVTLVWPVAWFLGLIWLFGKAIKKLFFSAPKG